jgi:NADPH-dependent ferric siderophore reductase
MTTDTSPTSEGADVPPPRRRRVMRRVRVTRVEQLSPRMVRVTFTGDDVVLILLKPTRHWRKQYAPSSFPQAMGASMLDVKQRPCDAFGRICFTSVASIPRRLSRGATGS